MDLPDSLTDHWIAWYFAGDAVLFLVAYFLWNAEMNGTAALLFLLALCPPLAFLAVLLEPAPG